MVIGFRTNGDFPCFFPPRQKYKTVVRKFNEDGTYLSARVRRNSDSRPRSFMINQTTRSIRILICVRRNAVIGRRRLNSFEISSSYLRSIDMFVHNLNPVFFRPYVGGTVTFFITDGGRDDIQKSSRTFGYPLYDRNLSIAFVFGGFF